MLSSIWSFEPCRRSLRFQEEISMILIFDCFFRPTLLLRIMNRSVSSQPEEPLSIKLKLSLPHLPMDSVHPSILSERSRVPVPRHTSTPSLSAGIYLYYRYLLKWRWWWCVERREGLVSYQEIHITIFHGEFPLF